MLGRPEISWGDAASDEAHGKLWRVVRSEARGAFESESSLESFGSVLFRYALNFVDLHWALNYQQMKHAKTELLSRLTIDRLKTQGKLVALVLLDEKARHLQYTLPAELPEVSERTRTPQYSAQNL